MNFKGIDIAKNLRIIDSLKADLLACLSHLYSQMASETCEDLKDVALDTLSDAIIISYLLSRRLGVEYTAIEKQITSKIRLGLLQEHDTEKYFGDLSALSRIRAPQVNSGNVS